MKIALLHKIFIKAQKAGKHYKDVYPSDGYAEDSTFQDGLKQYLVILIILLWILNVLRLLQIKYKSSVYYCHFLVSQNN